MVTTAKSFFKSPRNGSEIWVIIGLIILIVLNALSCKSSESHLAEAIIKDPSLLKVQKFEFTDSIYIAPIQSSFVMRTDGERITTAKQDGIIVTKTIYDTAVVFDVTCPPDTIVVTNTEFVPQIQYIEAKNKRMWWMWAALFVFGLFGLLVIFRGALNYLFNNRR